MPCSKRVRVSVRRVSCVAAIASLWLAAPLVAQDEPQPLLPILVVNSSDLSTMLPSEKDAGLRAALMMIPDRLRELKGAIPEAQQIPDDLLGLTDTLFENPWRLAVGTRGFNAKTGQPLIEAALSVNMEEGGKGAADAMHARIATIIQMAGGGEGIRNSEKFPGMQFAMTPAGMVAWGPRQAKDGWRYEMIVGPVKDPDALFDALPAAPENLSTVFRGTLHLANLSPLIERYLTPLLSVSPQGRTMLEGLRAQGILGETAMRLDMVSGFTGGTCVTTFFMRDAKAHAEAMNLPTTTIDASDFALIPADATWFGVGEANPAAAWESMKAQFAQMPGGAEQFEQALAMVRDQTGVDFEQDVIAALGTTGGMYFSDSTGGGSLTSAVMFAELRAAPRLREAIAKLSGAANAMIQQNMPVPPGSVAVRLVSFERDGVAFTQLRVPGIPVPFEPTIATTGTHAIFGLNPQATMAAVAQSRAAAGQNVLKSPAFVAATEGLGSGKLTSLSFIDASRTMRDGFGVLSFAGSALANAVRSVNDDSRDPGMIVPTLGELSRGARGTVQAGYWSGDDFVYEMRTDSSALVNAAAAMGVGDMAPLFIGAIIGGSVTGGIMQAQAQGLLPDPGMMGEFETYEEDGEAQPVEGDQPRQPRRF